MLLLESARQAAHAASDRAEPVMVSAMDVAFRRYVEFDTPCLIDAAPESPAGPHPRVRVDARQGGLSAFTASATLAGIGDL